MKSAMSFKSAYPIWKVTAAIPLLLCFCLLSSALCLLIPSYTDSDDNLLNERCIMCHSRTVVEAMVRPDLHRPFIEYQCIVCHLADNAARDEQQSGRLAAGPEEITGSTVTQEQLWRKKKVITSSGKGIEHLVAVSGLDFDAQYRFRVTVRDAHGSAGSREISCNWLGLVGHEVPLSGGRLSYGGLELTAGENGTIHDLMIYRDENATIFISWHTPEKLFGEVQLEELAGLGPEGGAATENSVEQPSPGHPLLRNPEAMSIEICYSCHPERSLGASHPVEIYATKKEVTIPESLPTVNNGMLTCVTCHNPHSGLGKKLVREVIVTKSCVACHTEYAGISRNTIFN